MRIVGPMAFSLLLRGGEAGHRTSATHSYLSTALTAGRDVAQGAGQRHVADVRNIQTDRVEEGEDAYQGGVRGTSGATAGGSG